MSVLESNAMARVVDALASARFAEGLLQFVHEAAGADHCIVYRFAQDGARVLGAASLDGSNLARRNALRYTGEGFWQRDPFVGGRGGRASGPSLARVEAGDIPDLELREEFYLRPRMREKVFISGARGSALYAVSVFRSRSAGCFSSGDIGRMGACAELLLSCASQHDRLASERHDAAAELASVPQIEERIRAWQRGLTGREAQVCARILYGRSAEGIGLELGISAESVATYRKRAYRRLRIATRHELLKAYLRSL